MARKKAYQRHEILEKISHVFLTKGYESTSLADLMAETGLNKKSLYNEFGHKEALFLVVLQDYIEKESASLQPILLAKPGGISNIKRFFLHLADKFLETGCLLTLSLNEASCISDDALDLINQTLLSLESGFQHNLQAERVFSDEQVRFFARNILALMQGITSLTRSEKLREGNIDAALNFLDWLLVSTVKASDEKG